MRKLRVEEVFKPGAFPEHTYVTRVSSEFPYTYEFRLQQALNTVGYLTSIIGPSKTGKTVLCEKVVGPANIISLTGNDFKHSHSFWGTIASHIGLPLEGENMQKSTIGGDNSKGITETKEYAHRERYSTSKDRVIEYFKRNGLILVLDDFHSAPEEMQYDMAYQLKDAIRKEFKAIVISLPHRADDAIRKNPDLSGRLSLINVEPWQMEALREIAIEGFRKLDIQITDEIATKLADESLTSPQLMQSICLNLGLLLRLNEDPAVTEILEDTRLNEAFKVTTINLPYKEVARKLMEGPNPRGQKRKTYQLKDGVELDIYELLLKAIAMDPPVVSISVDEIKVRIDKLLDRGAGKPDRNKIKSSIAQVQAIMNASDSIYQVFEWKEETIYILNPLFLFYLRWGAY